MRLILLRWIITAIFINTCYNCFGSTQVANSGEEKIVKHTLLSINGKNIFVIGRRFSFKSVGLILNREVRYESKDQDFYIGKGNGAIHGENPNIVILSKDGMVTLNGRNMDQNINAVITESGDIVMGSFIRTFD